MRKAVVVFVSVLALLMLLWAIFPALARFENESASALLYCPASDMYLFVALSRTEGDSHVYYVYLMIPDGGDLTKPLWSEGQYSESAGWKPNQAWATGTVTYQATAVAFSATWQATSHKPTITYIGDGVYNVARDALANAAFGSMAFVQNYPGCSAVVYSERIPPGY